MIATVLLLIASGVMSSHDLATFKRYLRRTERRRL